MTALRPALDTLASRLDTIGLHVAAAACRIAETREDARKVASVAREHTGAVRTAAMHGECAVLAFDAARACACAEMVLSIVNRPERLELQEGSAGE